MLLPGKTLCPGLFQYKIHEPYFTAFLRYFLRLDKYDVFIQIEVLSTQDGKLHLFSREINIVWKLLGADLLSDASHIFYKNFVKVIEITIYTK